MQKSQRSSPRLSVFVRCQTSFGCRPAQLVIPALPYFLSFAAGAMLYVVVEELIPEMSQGKHSNIGTVFFAVGFSVMMTLDVALG